MEGQLSATEYKGTGLKKMMTRRQVKNKNRASAFYYHNFDF